MSFMKGMFPGRDDYGRGHPAEAFFGQGMDLDVDPEDAIGMFSAF